jgi:hypothetical protein
MSSYDLGPDYFRMREVAVTSAIELNRARLGVSLFDCPAVTPPPDELRVVRQAHARATALGLVLPPYPKTTVRFVRAPESRQGGETRERNGVIEMVFVVSQPLTALRHLALHELMHVHQYATDGQRRWDEPRLSVEERESQAEAFAWQAMVGWQPR